MNFIFYDFETIGVDKNFDQIIQAAAVCTDENLNPIDEINLKCKLRPFKIPDPFALIVNGIDPSELEKEQTHYEMVLLMVKKFREWSKNGAHFLGYNSIYFDEEFLRQSLYQNLLPIFLTNTAGSDRGDILKILHMAVYANPDGFKYYYNEKGNASFKLEHFASINGIQHDNAHDALGDVNATIGVAKLIKEKTPEVWKSAVISMSVAETKKMLLSNDFFLMNYNIQGRNYPFGVCYIAHNDSKGANDKEVIMFDLQHDPRDLKDFNVQRMKHFLKPPRSELKKYFRKIQINKHQILLSSKYVLQLEKYSRIGDEKLRERVEFIRTNKTMCERVKLALSEMQEEVAEKRGVNQEDILPEQAIYSGGFPTKNDQAIMSRFHEISWDQRFEIALKLGDDRYKEFAMRLLYEQNPVLLPENLRVGFERKCAMELTEMNGIINSPYRTISEARKILDDRRIEAEESMGGEEKKKRLTKLERINNFLDRLDLQYKKMLH